MFTGILPTGATKALTTPVQTTTAGSYMQQGNSLLNSALNAWVQVEQVKAARATSGGDQVQRQLTPELANGAGVQIDASKDTAKPKQGFKVNMPLLLSSVALLGVALYLRK